MKHPNHLLNFYLSLVQQQEPEVPGPESEEDMSASFEAEGVRMDLRGHVRPASRRAFLTREKARKYLTRTK